MRYIDIIGNRNMYKLLTTEMGHLDFPCKLKFPNIMFNVRTVGFGSFLQLAIHLRIWALVIESVGARLT